MGEASAITVLLIRSPETIWDTQGRLCGSTDLPLADEGRRRLAERIGALGSEDRLDLVYCGPDEGSVEIADLVVRRLGGKKKVIDGLREVDLGLWEGQRLEDLQRRVPKAFKQWREDPQSVTPPEGEGAAEARARILGEVGRLLDKARHTDHRVALVLRPLVHAIVTEALGASEDGGECEWRTLWSAQVRELRAASRAGAA